jgi:hypothetical protein
MNYQEKRKLFIKFNKSRLAIINHPTMSDNYKCHMLDRLYKALGILQHHDYFVQEKEKYNPDRNHCSCPDMKYWNTAKRDYHGPCKHRLAVAMQEITLSYTQLSF